MDFLIRHNLLDWISVIRHKLADFTSYYSYWLLVPLPCDVIRKGSSAWLAQFSLATTCFGSILGEKGGRRHFCLLGDLLGIFISVVEHAGCTAVAVMSG